MKVEDHIHCIATRAHRGKGIENCSSGSGLIGEGDDFRIEGLCCFGQCTNLPVLAELIDDLIKGEAVWNIIRFDFENIGENSFHLFLIICISGLH